MVLLKVIGFGFVTAIRGHQCYYRNPEECGCKYERSADYRGDINVTVAGVRCQEWDVHEPHPHEDRYHPSLPNMSSEGLVGNSCRNPLGAAKGPWCYTTDKCLRWDYCSVPVCGEPTTTTTTPGPGCATYNEKCGCKEVWQRDYRGDRDRTVSGRRCIPWVAQSVVYHYKYRPEDPYYMHEGLDSNYCRNPRGELTAPWCYIDEPSLDNWEYCSVPFCETTITDTSTSMECGSAEYNQGDYRGTISMTRSGIICQHWHEQQPHGHKNWSAPMANYEFAGLDENYCRNPNGADEAPWCYTVDPHVRWEYCDVPICTSTTPVPTTEETTVTMRTTTIPTTVITTTSTTTTMAPRFYVTTTYKLLNSNPKNFKHSTGHVGAAKRSPIDETNLHLVQYEDINKLQVIRTDKDHEIIGEPINVGFGSNKFHGQDMVVFPDGSYAVCMFAENNKAGGYHGTWSYVVLMNKYDEKQWTKAITFKNNVIAVYNCQMVALGPWTLGIIVVEVMKAGTGQLNYYTASKNGVITFKKTLVRNAELSYMSSIVALTNNRFSLAYKTNLKSNVRVDIFNFSGNIIQNVLNRPCAQTVGEKAISMSPDELDYQQILAKSFHVVYLNTDSRKIDYSHCTVYPGSVHCTVPKTATTARRAVNRPRIINYKGNLMINYFRMKRSFGVAYLDRQLNIINQYESDALIPRGEFIYTLHTSVLSNGKVLLSGIYRKYTDGQNFAYIVDEMEWCPYFFKDSKFHIEDMEGGAESYTVECSNCKFDFDERSRRGTIYPYQKPKDYAVKRTDGEGNVATKIFQWPKCKVGTGLL